MHKGVQLKGPGAIVAIVVIAAFGGLRHHSRTSSLQTQAVDAIKTQLISDYTRDNLPELQEATQGGSVYPSRAADIAGQLNADNINIVSIRAHGHGGNYVARVEIRVGGAEPPDGKPVRYFKLRHSSVTGWRVTGETSAWSYRLKRFVEDTGHSHAPVDGTRFVWV